MSYEKKERIVTAVLVLVFLAAVALHYLFAPWGFYRAVAEEEACLRRTYVTTAEGWLGRNEADGSHRCILAIYNGHEPLAMGYEVTDSDSWCAAFVSAAAIKAGLTDIIPTECGCERQIGLFQSLGRWEENDNTIPQPGDLIYYDWEQKSPGEALGWSDHVGIVVGVKWPFVKVIEGNKDDSVSYRFIPLGHKSIRGYGRPDYAGYAPGGNSLRTWSDKSRISIAPDSRPM